MSAELNPAREAFEKWITAPPIEAEVDRNPDDHSISAWPGQYRNYNVQLAWEAWQAALESAETIGWNDRNDGRREWWSGGAWIYPGDRVAILRTGMLMRGTPEGVDAENNDKRTEP